MKTLNKRNFFNITIRTAFISAQISKLQGSTKMNQLDGFKVNDILRIKFLSKWCNLKSCTSYFNIWLFKNLRFQQQKVMHRKSITAQLKYLRQTIVKIVVDKYRVVQTQKTWVLFIF